MPRSLVLASRSPRRIELLASAGLIAECIPSDAEESTEHPESPRLLAVENARMKGRLVALARPDAVVLAADTIVVLDGVVFGKPRDLNSAHSMLRELSGRTHEVITAVCIGCDAESKRVQFEETTRVRFRALGDSEIASYLASINPLDKAGAYAAQDDGGRIIECIEGSLTNVIGLPLDRTLEALRTHFPDVMEK